ncbi:MAG: ribonucleoside-diphosphate reductase subunit alpha, partial [Candidatus Margulisbacteria bacterium]|nr:ribonucleoside-diphosphate reductase subunit alpha [Candidatus Margulisiibacteriota bacterium]
RRRAHDIHPAVFISDLFMKRVKQDGDWTLFSPDQVPGLHDAYGRKFEELYVKYENSSLPLTKKIKAKDLWRKMLTMLYETGHPWITFKCTSNLRSPQSHVGTVHCSNLCTEITLNTSEDETAVCNLASINLSKMIKDGKLNEDLIKSTVSTGMRMLDNVVDINFYPTVEAKNSNLRHRPVGLGVMGYQDALYQLDIPFDCDENVLFADRSMEMVSYYAILSSSELAGERGAYSSYNGSKWEMGMLPLDTLDLLEEERDQKLDIDRDSTLDWDFVKKAIKNNGMRNSNTMAIAPTATIANIAGVVPCVEPIFKNIYMKENLSGNFCVINRYLIDSLTKIGLWSPNMLAKIKINNGSLANIHEIPGDIKQKFKEVFEINPLSLIRAAAKRSKWIDQSASTNLFLTTKSGKEISDIYSKVWEMGMKTTYYLRTLAASQITKTTEVVENKSDEKPQNTEYNTPSNTDAGEIKACLIADPDCEACQ